jgi:hypothetical protein
VVVNLYIAAMFANQMLTGVSEHFLSITATWFRYDGFHELCRPQSSHTSTVCALVYVSVHLYLSPFPSLAYSVYTVRFMRWSACLAVLCDLRPAAMGQMGSAVCYTMCLWYDRLLGFDPELIRVHSHWCSHQRYQLGRTMELPLSF